MGTMALCGFWFQRVCWDGMSPKTPTILGICTISVAAGDALPVELLDFVIEDTQPGDMKP